MLPKNDNKFDVDGYAMLLLSLLVMIATAGISYLLCLKKIISIAKNETSLCDADATIFVLGKKLINDQPDNEYVLRLKRVHTILKTNLAAQVIVLGGKTGDANITEAQAGKIFLEQHKIDTSQIKLEESSRNTLENLKNAIDLFNLINKKIVIVTNRYHLARAKQMANGFGLEVKLCAAEEKLDINPLLLLKLMVEALHTQWYVSGRVYAKLTNNTRMINRIGKF